MYTSHIGKYTVSYRYSVQDASIFVSDVSFYIKSVLALLWIYFTFTCCSYLGDLRDIKKRQYCEEKVKLLEVFRIYQ